MRDIKPSLIGKSLEEERDFYLNLNGDLSTEVLKRQINIFFSIYILSISDENDSLDGVDTLKLYRSFYSTKFNGVRFLLELFLTSFEIFSQENDKEKNMLTYSMAISEKINIYSINKDILLLNSSNDGYKKTLKDGERNYIDFLKKYGKISPLVPDKIENFFPSGQNLLTYSKESEFYKNFGFKYYRHSKLNYGNIMRDNEKLKALIERLKRANIFSSVIDEGFLRNIYFLISGEMHPTISTIEHFETFISKYKNKSEQVKIVLDSKDNYDAFLKVIGILMDTLYKEQRGISLENLNYTK
ncbi:MAG TPA: hypothetical protein VGO63_02015 [Candidatus Paceibacterota bacterium]|jgi:hypothetical protein|nr:hypothetical protein [Candidatus Paceibacterota bacterium]